MHTMYRRFIAIAALLLALAGCATGPGGKESTAVEDRAIKRWELLIAQNPREAYEYLTPGYRKTHPVDPYAAAMGSRPVKWTSVKFMDKECEEDSCTVRLMISFEVRINAGIPGPIESVDVQKEKWVKVGGKWYHLPRT
jgi:hypothetical protein